MQGHTVADIADWYIEEARAGRHKPTAQQPRNINTMYGLRRTIARSVKPHVGSLPFADLTTDKMQAVLDWTCEQVSAKEAELAKFALRTLSEFAVWKGIIPKTRAIRLAVEPTASRKVMLSDEAFKKGWDLICNEAAEGALPTQISANALLLMVSTLQTPMAVTEMRTADVDLANNIWHRPVANPEIGTLDIPLSDRSVGYINAALRLGASACGKTDFVFPASHRGFKGEKPIDEKTPSVMMRRARRSADLENITPQMFLDTAEAWLAAAWVHPAIVRIMVGYEDCVPDAMLLSHAVRKWDDRLAELVSD